MVITGAFGFLGQEIVREFSNISNIELVLVSRRHMSGALLVRQYADTPGGDVLIHLAEASDRSWVKSHYDQYESEVIATCHALTDGRYARTIYLSSAVLYGFDGPRRARLTQDPIVVSDSYGLIKEKAEQFFSDQGVILRPTNIYGEKIGSNTVIGSILGQLGQDGPLKILRGDPVRDFLWAKDIANLIVKIALKSNCKGIYNVGTGVGTSILDLANLALSLSGEGGREVEVINKSPDVSHLIVDIMQTKNVFNWAPAMTLESGLMNLLNARVSDDS